jgi:hypothetical protein
MRARCALIKAFAVLTTVDGGQYYCGQAGVST